MNCGGMKEQVQAQHPAQEAAQAGDLERITVTLLDALARSGYVNERTAQSTELKVRRLVRRLGIPGSDTETWQGILRQILWKLKREEPPDGLIRPLQQISGVIPPEFVLKFAQFRAAINHQKFNTGHLSEVLQVLCR